MCDSQGLVCLDHITLLAIRQHINPHIIESNINVLYGYDIEESKVTSNCFYIDRNRFLKMGMRNVYSILCHAIIEDHMQLVAEILSGKFMEVKVDVNMRRADGCHRCMEGPLAAAIQRHNLPLVQRLVKYHNAEVDLAINDAFQPLDVAFDMDNVEALSLLLGYCDSKYPLLHKACFFGATKCAKLLLSCQRCGEGSINLFVSWSHVIPQRYMTGSRQSKKFWSIFLHLKLSFLHNILLFINIIVILDMLLVYFSQFLSLQSHWAHIGGILVGYTWMIHVDITGRPGVKCYRLSEYFTPGFHVYFTHIFISKIKSLISY